MNLLKCNKVGLVVILCLIIGAVYIGKPYIKNTVNIFKMVKNLDCEATKFNINNNYQSQFYEDYVLWHVFKDTKNGKYIDVGANDPDQNSATKTFYLKEWQGIHIEPNPELYKLLLVKRPKSINLQLAISDHSGVSELLIPGDKHGIASLDTKIESVMKNDKITRVKVQTSTLNEVIKEHNFTDIDFIKIDVEGYEGKVLKGMDLKAYRPKVIVAEYFSPIKSNGYLDFEEYLYDNDYLLGLDDTLNRYYYRKENPEFGPKFRAVQKCVAFDLLVRDVYCVNLELCKR